MIYLSERFLAATKQSLANCSKPRQIRCAGGQPSKARAWDCVGWISHSMYNYYFEPSIIQKWKFNFKKSEEL